MPYPIEDKLVVGVSSNALFDLTEEDEIFRTQGIDAYRNHQVQNRNKPLEKGLAFPFIRRFLRINEVYKDLQPVEVVFLSRNSPETGLRILQSVKKHRLDISRGAFTSGDPPFEYIESYNISLFLSTDETDVQSAIGAGYPAGRILRTSIQDDESDIELRVAFDFDGVIADDEAEKVYQTGDLDLFHQHEVDNANIPHSPGPLADFFKKLSGFQRLENEKAEKDTSYKRILKTAIVTARNAPSHQRAINTLENWGVTVDHMFFLGGIKKSRVLKVLKPHLFIDDQLPHLDLTLENVPLVHIPFGSVNTQVAIETKPDRKEPASTRKSRRSRPDGRPRELIDRKVSEEHVDALKATSESTSQE